MAEDLVNALHDRGLAAQGLAGADSRWRGEVKNGAVGTIADRIERSLSGGGPHYELGHSEGTVNIANALHEYRHRMLRYGGLSANLSNLHIVQMGSPLPFDIPIYEWARSQGATISSIVLPGDAVTVLGDGRWRDLGGRNGYLDQHAFEEYLPHVTTQHLRESVLYRLPARTPPTYAPRWDRGGTR